MTAVGAALAVVVVALLASAGGWGDPSARQARRATGGPTSVQPTPAALVGQAPPAPSPGAATVPAPPPDETALPSGSGTGRRIVLDQSAPRVWLVGTGDRVRRTYLGSGSVVDNLHPGTYAVYSRSRWAVGVDDAGVMQYFVRFTKGPAGAAIGFHTIPTKHGVPLQSERQLGTPRSHGCIRQRTDDAIALWDFAPVGTPVVVVA